MNLIRVGLEVANDLTSLLDKLGRGRKFVETLLNFGVAAGEVRQCQVLQMNRSHLTYWAGPLYHQISYGKS